MGERKCPNFDMVAKGIRTRAPTIASPAFYRRATAFHNKTKHSPRYQNLPRLFSNVVVDIEQSSEFWDELGGMVSFGIGHLE